MNCIEIDFDYTIAHFRTGSKGFFKIFSRYGVSEANLSAAYEATAHSKEKRGFTFEKMLKGVARIAVIPPSHRRKLQAAFGKWLSANLTLYPESLTALTTWHDQFHIPVFIVTAGAKIYQRQKVTMAHVPCDEVVVVPHADGKVSVTKMLLRRFGPPIVFIDDKESELDTLRDAGIRTTEVLTVHIRRHDSPYKDQKPRYKHLEIASLNDKRLAMALKP